MKRYELIFTIIKYGDSREEADKQVEYIHDILEDENENYSYSTYCTGEVDEQGNWI